MRNNLTRVGRLGSSVVDLLIDYGELRGNSFLSDCEANS